MIFNLKHGEAGTIFLFRCHIIRNSLLVVLTMNNQNVTALERWVVRDNNGEVIARFATQTKAIDFANREQKLQQAIVLIDISHCAVQLINRAARDEKVG